MKKRNCVTSAPARLSVAIPLVAMPLIVGLATGTLVNRIRIQIVAVALLLAVTGGIGLPTVQASYNEAPQASCDRLTGKQKIRSLAKKIVADQISDTEHRCYASLTDEERGQVFGAMATERGISLRRELRKGDSGDGQVVILAGWRQLVERIPFSAVFKTIRRVVVSWRDDNCDSDPTDEDYIFRIDFPYPQSDPDSVRSFSQHLGVDAMLVWYQLRYGGINSWGDTTNGMVYTCLGGGGVNTAGGRQTVHDHLKMHDNN